MTGTATYFAVKKPYFSGERLGGVEFTWFLNGNAVKRYTDRMVRQRIEAPSPPFRKGAERSVEVSVVTLDTLKGINIYPAVYG